MIGLETKMALAPKARHLRTSVPLLIPESMKISACGYLVLTFLTIVGRTLIVDGADLAFK